MTLVDCAAWPMSSPPPPSPAAASGQPQPAAGCSMLPSPASLPRATAEPLQQTLDRAVLGDGLPVPPPQTEWYQAMAAQPTTRPALEHLVSGVSQILERV